MKPHLQEQNLLVRRIGQIYLIVQSLSAVPFFSWILGARFLPSTGWVQDRWLIATAVGILLSGVGFLLTNRGMRLRDLDDVPGPIGCAFIFIALFVLNFWLGRSLVLLGGPLFYAMAAGEQTELPYVVDKAAGFNHRKWQCPEKIELKDMPFFFDKLCDLPKEFRDTLSPGQTIIVTGYGSSAGVFVSSARVVSNP